MLTGGHLAPALALIEELEKKKKDISLVFVGRKYAIDSDKTLSLEYKEITKRNIPFIPLQSGRFTRIFDWQSIKNLIKIIPGLIKAYSIIKEQKPDVIMTFGGYLALPISFWGYIFHIPLYTHEQTINPGLANRLIAFFSRTIFVAFAETIKFFPKHKTILTGNPVRSSIVRINKKPFDINKNLPVIYITGGTLGSHSINQIIKKIITALLHDCTVIHQTGETKEYQDYEDLSAVRERLPKELSKRYFLVKHFLDDEIGYIFNLADLVIGRAGANTFFELILLSKPVIFIPLPWSSGGEQEKQAEIFRNAGAGVRNRQHQISSRVHETGDPGFPRVDLHVRRLDGEFASMRHGVAGLH